MCVMCRAGEIGGGDAVRMNTVPMFASAFATRQPVALTAIQPHKTRTRPSKSMVCRRRPPW